MSAKMGGLTPQVSRDLNLLAPKFKAAVELAIADCNAQNPSLEAMVYEGFRSQELQAIYYARGRTVIPPTHTVTNAPTSLFSWHGYGLAVDVVHRRFFWTPPEGEAWFRKVAAIFKQHGCSWGGDWKHADTPHFQWGRCKPSPSDQARKLMATGGVQAVWQAVGAA
jgi:peptidoglycan L-alanyl-D-glutamate endopeptidase CwlK